MSTEAWITVLVLVVAMGLMVAGKVRPTEGLIAANIVLLLAGVVSFQDAFKGFASSAPIAVAAFYVVAAGIEKTGALQPALPFLLDSGAYLRRTVLRLTVPVALASGFVSNTPIVAMLVEPIRAWQDRSGRPASKLLIPLSYAAIVGGSISLIGTSTNLLVADLYQQETGIVLGLFSTAVVGVPVTLVGLVLIAILGPLVLPDRRSNESVTAEDMRAYVASLRVETRLGGRTVRDAGLGHLRIAQIERDGEVLESIDGDTVLQGGDLLAVVASAQEVVELERHRGLQSSLASEVTAVSSTRSTFFEAVLGASSPCLDMTVEEADFPNRYGAAIVAVHRDGRRLASGDLRRLKLERRDTLLVLASRDFRTNWHDRTDFLLVNRLGGPPPTSTRRAPLALGVLAGIVLLAMFGVLSVAEAALAGVLILVGTRTVTYTEAFDAIDWPVVVMIGSALGIGVAVQTTGLADQIATRVVNVFGGFGNTFLVFGLVLATMVLTELISNSAAAALMLPVALQIAGVEGINTTTMAIGIAIGASCSFITPIGYQTNTMVLGPGGYTFTDYLRLGAPMAIAVLITITTMVILFS